MFFARRNVVATAVLLALSAIPVAVYAQVTYSFNLPGQPLADALRTVGSQGGINVAFEPATVQGRNAPALRGNYSVQQALDHLLAGSGLVLRTTQGGSFLVEMGNTSGSVAHPALVQPKSFDFHIESQTLAGTLRTIERTTGQRIDFDTDLVSKKKADVVDGHLTATEALQQALVGTGMHAAITTSGVLTVVPGPASASEDTQWLPEVEVRATVVGLAATRVATELKEIPQSVSVISQDTLQQQNANNIADALAWATGISVSTNTSMVSNFTSRGFALSEMHIDGGGPIQIQNNSTTATASPFNDLSEYDHIEVLRGADALFGGAGDPGATISLQRKQPLAEDQASVTFNAGSFNYFREVLDATGSLGFDGALRGRIVATNTSEDYSYNVASLKQHKVYGILQYDLTPMTMLTVGGSLEQNNAVPFTTGLPLYIDGADPHLPRSTALAFPWNRSTGHTDEAFVQLDQRFNDDWKLKIESTMINQDSNSHIGASDSSGINAVTNIIPGVVGVGTASQSNLALTGDATLTGAFDWGGHRQEVIVGMDYARQTYNVPQQDAELIGPPLNPWSFDPTAYSTVAPPSLTTPTISVNNYSYTKQIGGYAALRLHFWDGWSAIIGARDNYYRSESRFSESYDSGPPYGTSSISGAPITNVATGVVTPYAGLTYDINKQYTLYASYADIYKPNSGEMTAAGSTVPPIRGVNLEVGAKAAWYDGLLNGSIALFKINQRNNATYFNPGGNYSNPNCCFVEGDNTSKGVETELSGQLTPNWQIGAGYTFDINRLSANLPNTPGIQQGPLNSASPKHLLKLWTNYRLPGVADRWSVGGGLQAQSSSYTIGEACPTYDALGNCVGFTLPYTIRQGFYTVATLRAAYQVNTHWSIALNIDNLFDRTYYQTLGSIYGSNWYGTPRSFMLTIRGQL